MSEVKRYTLEMVSSEAGEVHWMHDNVQGLSAPLGEYVRFEDYAALEAENDELCKAIKLASDVGIKVADEVIRLKAKVERLTKELADEKCANANVENRQQDHLRGLSMQNFNLKSENERLRKAGDAIVKDNLKWVTNHDNIKAWNAAREGKPSV